MKRNGIEIWRRLLNSNLHDFSQQTFFHDFYRVQKSCGCLCSKAAKIMRISTTFVSIFNLMFCCRFICNIENKPEPNGSQSITLHTTKIN